MSPPAWAPDPEPREKLPPEAPPLAAAPTPGESTQEDSFPAVEEAAPTPEEATKPFPAVEEAAPAHEQAQAGNHQDEAPSPTELSTAEEPAAHSPSAETAAYGPEATTPDSEEEKLHDQARRFARLLISEILLYNPDQVYEGKQQHDLANRLKEDLERSEKMYRQRVAPHVAAETNYFHEEVLRTLADGDPTAMGD
jgi:hypothetical protein